MKRRPKQPSSAVRILVERTADKRFLEGMFRKELEAGKIDVDACVTTSGITGRAQRSLLEHHNQPLVLVFNAKTEDLSAIEDEYRGPVHRMLAKISATGWHV